MHEEKKVNKYSLEQIKESRFSIPKYNLSLLFCLPNMNFLSYITVEISLMKNVVRKKKRIYTRQDKQENAGA